MKKELGRYSVGNWKVWSDRLAYPEPVALPWRALAPGLRKQVWQDRPVQPPLALPPVGSLTARYPSATGCGAWAGVVA